LKIKDKEKDKENISTLPACELLHQSQIWVCQPRSSSTVETRAMSLKTELLTVVPSGRVRPLEIVQPPHETKTGVLTPCGENARSPIPSRCRGREDF
jgi:hypothetical protein